MLDAYLLRYFLAVVEAGAFTKAAARCNVTQPTLSAGIKKLETQLGQPMFDRSTRRVELTPAGARFLPRAQAMIREYNLALQDISEIAQAPQRSAVRLGVGHTVAAPLLNRMSAAVAEARPQWTLSISEGSEQELGNRLAQGRLDLAIRVVTGSEPDLPVLLREGYALALTQSHPLASQSQVDAEDLAQDHMIARRRCEMLQATSLHFTSRNVRPPIAMRTDHCDRAMAYVAAGFGVTVAPDCFTHPGVVRRPMRDFSPRRFLCLAGGDSALARAVAQNLSAAKRLG